MSKAKTIAKWSDVYHELALLLKEFYDKHKRRTGNVLFRRIYSDKVLLNLNPWIRNISSYGDDKSIDPVHFFTSFNHHGEIYEKRVAIINHYFQILGAKKGYSKIDFTGCPAPFSLKILSTREQVVQNQIWATFKNVIEQKQNALTGDVFERLGRWYGIDIPSFSIFLFWVDAKNFIPIDKNSEILLFELGVVNAPVRKLDDYKKLLPEQETDLYIRVALLAYQYTKWEGFSKEELLKIGIEKRFLKKRSLAHRRFDFKIVAIEPVKGIDKQLRKNLHIGTIYRFYKEFKFKPNGNIEINNLSLKTGLYDSGKLKINVNAIVGKNGSGKSTISELLFVTINNIAAKTAPSNHELIYQPNAYLNLYYHIGSLIKLELRGERIYIVEYELDNNLYTEGKRRQIGQSDLELLFYTIAINYSHFSLNSRDIGDWIELLFHKNDGYQTPIVLNPFREEGNIDINTEAQLTKQRLLSNVLEVVDLRDKDNLRKITDNGRIVKEVVFRINERKVNEIESQKVKNEDLIFNEIKRHFRFTTRVSKQQLSSTARKYLVNKAVKIARQYVTYHEYLDGKRQLKLSTLTRYIMALDEDSSHITYKFKQAVNFFRYDTSKFISLGRKESIEKISRRIDALKSKNSSRKEIRTIELIPPPFLEYDLYLNDDSNFKDLSSGEKQKIYTVTTVLYHLNNLNSIASNPKLISYPFVNIFFDEIELYFHPDMQRTFIDYLIKYLGKATFSNLISLNLSFITHSPFILSDIPNNNILYLQQNGKPDETLNTERTFAGNLHELLGNNFYMDDAYMGEFASRKTNSAINYLNSIIGKKSTRSKENWTQESISQFIELVGEPLLRDSLREMYQLAFPASAEKKYSLS
jgi:energy-coupling factor transporter ATP-binding protein EcfA2